LRNPKGWARWVAVQAPADAAVLRKAAMQYVAHEDTIQLLFEHDCLEIRSRHASARICDLVQRFYDASRRAWLDTLDRTSTDFKIPPEEAIMPRLQIEIAPPRSHSH
jgi:hypothetical protein